MVETRRGSWFALSAVVALAVAEGPDELVVTVETTLDRVGCSSCGLRAQAQDRMPMAVRDLSCLGRPARLVWIERRWRCIDADCEAKTWTEACEHADAQVVLPSSRSRSLSPGWRAGPAGVDRRRRARLVLVEVMNTVVEHGKPLADDPKRIGAVRQLGVDETSFLAADRVHATIYATGLFDLEVKVVIDMVEGNRAADLSRVEAGAAAEEGQGEGGVDRARIEKAVSTSCCSPSGRTPGRAVAPS